MGGIYPGSGRTGPPERVTLGLPRRRRGDHPVEAADRFVQLLR